METVFIKKAKPSEPVGWFIPPLNTTDDSFKPDPVFTEALQRLYLSWIYDDANYGGYVCAGSKVYVQYTHEPIRSDFPPKDGRYTYTTVLYRRDTGKFQAFTRSGDGRTSSYVLDMVSVKGRPSTSVRNAAPLMLALIASALETDMDFADNIFTFLHSMQLYPGVTDPGDKAEMTERIKKTVQTLQSQLETMLAPDTEESRRLLCYIPSPNIQMLQPSRIPAKFPDSAKTFGNPSFLNPAAEKKAADTPAEESLPGAETVPDPGKPVTTISGLAGLYCPHPDRILAPEELDMIPAIPDSYQIPPQVELAARAVKETTNRRNPMRNFLFRGTSGTGKTEAARMLAYALGLPYCFITCSADTETYDLLMQVIPDNGAETGELPGITATEMALDPAESYKAITGSVMENATEMDCMMAFADKAKQTVHNAGPRYKYVDSPLVEALQHGYVIELQEAAVISKPGVLVGLNSIWDQLGTVHLMDGRTIRRHQDCIIVITTNSSYEGCRKLNQSIISRQDLIVDFDLPDDESLRDRVMSESGYADPETVMKMIEVKHSVDRMLNENSVDDGDTGIRQLVHWATLTGITDDPYTAGLNTLISAATADPEMRIDLLSALESRFAPKGKGEERSYA